MTSESRRADERGQPRLEPPGNWSISGMAWAVLGLGLALSFAVWQASLREVTERARDRFDQAVTAAVAAIGERMADYEQTLRGGVGLFAASEWVSRAQWRRYVESLQADRQLPGIQGIGFALRVPNGEKQAHTIGIRSEGFAAYAIRPAGEREEYAPIIHLEPFAGRNLRAFGYDMFSEPVRRAAMERARDSGLPALSGKVTLVQETDKDVQAGTLMYVAVYRNALPHAAVEERRAALLGYVYAAFRMNDLMRGVLGEAPSELDLRLYDAGAPQDEHRLYEHTASAGIDQYRPMFERIDKLQVAGRQWVLHFASTPVFDAGVSMTEPYAVAAGRVVISALLFVLVASLADTRHRALALAERRTLALRESEQRTRAVVDNAIEGIITIDGMGIIATVNPAVERIFGYSPGELIGQNVGMLMPTPHREGHDGYLRAYQEGGAAKIIGTHREVVGRRRDGEVFSLELSISEMRLGETRHFIGIVRDGSARAALERALREREESFRSLAASAPVGIFQTDADGDCCYVNRYWCDLAGIPTAEAMGRGWLAALYPLDARRVMREWYKALQGDGRFVAEFRFITPDGRVSWLAGRAVPIRGKDAEVTGYIGTVLDITERKLAEETAERLRQAEAAAAQLGRLLDRSSNEIYIFDLHNLRFIHVNQGACRNLGYTADELAHMTPLDLKPEFSAAEFGALIEPLRHGQAEPLAFEARHRRKDGSLYPVEVRLQCGEHGERRVFVAIINDISERKRADEHIRRLAHHDALTGLPNRLLLRDRMEMAIEGAKRQRTRLGVLFIDLDRFKTINDSLGHHVGDELLRTVAQRLGGCVRSSDTVARMGGDEFVVLLDGIGDGGNAQLVARKILGAIGSAVRVGSHELHVTPSIGISIFPDDGGDTDTLMRNADAAMYQAKEAGRNGFAVFSQSLNRSALERLVMENDLRHALEREEFELHFQPQIDCRRNVITGMEALLRWRHAARGMIPPDQFIPLAEETGLIVPIGLWVLRAACEEVKRWLPRYPDFRIAVNLSPRQLERADLVPLIEDILREAGVCPAALELEITESTLMRNVDMTTARLQRLGALGVQLAIDDFGTGYSSLAYLKRFPIDRLKIDRSFVRDITADPDDAAIAKTIIAMAHALHLQVTAEGVETADQLRHLNSLACDEAQGYYFSRPVPAEQLEHVHRELIARRSQAECEQAGARSLH